MKNHFIAPFVVLSFWLVFWLAFIERTFIQALQSGETVNNGFTRKHRNFAKLRGLGI